MANWKRVLTEVDLTTGDILNEVIGGTGIQAVDNEDGTYTLNITETLADGSAISIGEDSIALALDGSTLATTQTGVKVSANGITNTEVADSVVTGQSANSTVSGGDDFFLYYSAQAGDLQKISGSNLASFISTEGGGDYDLERVLITTNQVAELQFSLDGTIEKKIRFANQPNETTVTTGSNGGEDAIIIGLASDVEIDQTFEVNTTGINGEVLRVHAGSGATSSVFETNVVIEGNLTVAGDTTTTVVDTLNVEDSTFIVNSDAVAQTISNGGMVLNVNNTQTAKIEWRGGNQLSGWNLTSDIDNSTATQGFEIAIMDFKAGVPDNTTDPVFGAGSFLYDTSNDHLYINLA